MRLGSLIESTQSNPDRPGYAGCASDCLNELAEGEELSKEDWLVAALVFATLAVAEEMRRLVSVGESVDINLYRGLA